MMSIILSFSLYFLFAGFSYRADVQFGYINSERIFTEYSKFQEAAKTYEEETLQLQNDLKQKQDEFEKQSKDFESKRLLMSEQKKEETLKELDRLSKEIRTFQADNFAPGGALEKRWGEITDPILKEVQSVIDRIGADEGFDIIIDTKNGTVLYGKKEFDLTDRLLEELKNIK